MLATRPTRTVAATALAIAADVAGVAPEELTREEYRRIRERNGGAAPSELAIRMRFGGWSAACSHAATLAREPTEVEAQVRDALYGVPAHVDRVGREKR